ncbi:hypothetical protein [Shimazuella soli]|uniref:hypothetical protein n=1 Tax=Shimazuella soli TaxID=1892854 RepID=UPI001F0DF12C|nr:hypothetical protein [Shimazuella soli]
MLKSDRHLEGVEPAPVTESTGPYNGICKSRIFAHRKGVLRAKPANVQRNQ